MSSAEMPIDALSAKKSVSIHSSLYPILTAAPIEEFEKEIISLKEKVFLNNNNKQQLKNGVAVNNMQNPDLIAVFPNLFQLLKNLVKTRFFLFYLIGD
jgi:hypothetical protein